MADGQIEKDKVLGLKQSLACFVVCWLIPGPEGPAVPVRQTTSVTTDTNLKLKKEKKKKLTQTFMFDGPLLGFDGE